MSYEEYQKLYDEWKETDSIKHKEELREEIYQIAVELMKKLCNLYAEYRKDFIGDSDYRSDRGCLSLATENMGRKNVWLRYTDHWKYGGECDFGIKIPMKYLDEKNIQELEVQLLDESITSLQKMIDETNGRIRALEKSRETFCNELYAKKKKRDKVNMRPQEEKGEKQ